MRGSNRKGLIGLAVALLFSAAACSSEHGAPGIVRKSPASKRARRRAYDGAPPVIPHENFGMDCKACHNEFGLEVKDVGFAPPSPHEQTAGLSALSNCRQCHVFRNETALFRDNAFRGLRQDLRRGKRLNPLAPPVRPHGAFMRENCQACHCGPAAREAIRCPHPERARCTQCHVDQKTTRGFQR